jgi:hypothetical protein
LWEFRFPEAQNVRGKVAKSRDLSDPKIKLVGDQNFLGPLFRVTFFPHSHLQRGGGHSRVWVIVPQPDTHVSSFRSPEQSVGRGILWGNWPMLNETSPKEKPLGRCFSGEASEKPWM